MEKIHLLHSFGVNNLDFCNVAGKKVIEKSDVCIRVFVIKYESTHRT